MVRRNPQLFTMHIVPEEDVTGFIVRQSFERSQGKVLIRPSTVADSTRRPGWVFPSGLGHLGEELQTKLPPVDELIDGHTRFPLYAKFLTEKDSKALREHHKGIAIKGVAARVGMTNGAFRGRMTMCPECMERDIHQNGYAIWHRLALMPGILACPVHKRPLLTFCEACEAGHRRVRTNWRPMRRCVCGGHLRVVARLDNKTQEMAISVASMADQILRGTGSSVVSSESVTQALHLYFGNCRRLHNRLNEALYQAIGPDYRSFLGIGLDTLKRLVGSLGHYGPIRNPIQNLAVIHAVFGGFDNFSDVLRAGQETVGIRFSNPESDKKIPDKRRKDRYRTKEQYIEWVGGLPWEQQANLRLTYRKWLLELLHENPAIYRAELKSQPGSKAALRYLLNVDKAWYDRTLPSRARKRCYVTQELINVRKIEQLTRHIQKRYELSLKERPMQRITKAYLLSNVSCETATNLVLTSEGIQMSLAACSETFAEWKKRVEGNNLKQEKCSRWHTQNAG